MRGTIAAIASDGTYGQIAGEDGQRYSYWTSEIRNGQGQVGHPVDFQLWQGQPVDIFIHTSVMAPPRPAAAPPSAAAPQPAAYATAAAGQRFGGGTSGGSGLAGVLGGLPPTDYWIALFTSPVGRISRLQFWLHGVLPIFVVGLVLGWIPLVGILVWLALTWASVCISFKRFHDVGYPGWWSLAIIVPMVAGVFLTVGAFYVTGFGILAKLLWIVSFLVWLAQMLFVYVRAGQEGPNQYGPDPLAA
jgi:uncharacterized membrane protein YhaH (DUF805 family)